MESRGEEQLRRQVRLEEAHVERVPGLRAEGVLGAGRMIVTEVIRVAAAVAATHLAAARHGAAAQAGERLMTAFDTIGKLSGPGAAISLGVPVALANGRFSLELEAAAAGVRVAGTGGASVVGATSVAGVVRRPGVAGVAGVVRGPGGPGGPGVEVVVEPAGGGGVAGPGRRGTGVVVWGSARDIAAAAGTPALTAGALLSWARKQVFGQVYAGLPDSAAAALRVVRDLEVLVLLDPGIGGGLWVDVDPVAQAPAATLLVEMTVSTGSADSELLFRVLQP